jgi:anti-sigma B factor antagonist
MQSRTIGDVRVLDWSGRITHGEETIALRQALRDLVQEGARKIVLNLGGVNYIDSSGIGELVAAYTSVTNLGGQLKLLNLTKRIRELLAITKLLTVFDVYDSESAAVASFK